MVLLLLVSAENDVHRHHGRIVAMTRTVRPRTLMTKTLRMENLPAKGAKIEAGDVKQVSNVDDRSIPRR